MNRYVHLTALAFTLVAPGWAAAQGRTQPRLVLNALDLDHDGQLSAAEIAAAPKSLLTLDRNGDGVLTADELSSRPANADMDIDAYVKQLMAFDEEGRGYLVEDDLPERMRGIFARGDANHDGMLTQAEIRGLAAKLGMPQGARTGQPDNAFRSDPILAALDTNHDGVIDATEILNAPAALLTLDRNHDGQLSRDEIAVKQPTAEDRVDHLLGEWDTDHNGKLSKAECPDSLAAQFDSVDTNHDGALDRTELLVYFQKQGDGQQHK